MYIMYCVPSVLEQLAVSTVSKSQVTRPYWLPGLRDRVSEDAQYTTHMWPWSLWYIVSLPYRRRRRMCLWSVRCSETRRGDSRWSVLSLLTGNTTQPFPFPHSRNSHVRLLVVGCTVHGSQAAHAVDGASQHAASAVSLRFRVPFRYDTLLNLETCHTCY